jgi:hypothetical protein
LNPKLEGLDISADERVSQWIETGLSGKRKRRWRYQRMRQGHDDSAGDVIVVRVTPDSQVSKED